MLQRPRGPSHRQREMEAGTSRAQAAPSLGTGRVVTALPGDHREHSFLHVMAQFTALWWDAKMHIQSQGGRRRDGRRRVSLRPGRTLETGHRALQPWRLPWEGRGQADGLSVSSAGVTKALGTWTPGLHCFAKKVGRGSRRRRVSRGRGVAAGTRGARSVLTMQAGDEEAQNGEMRPKSPSRRVAEKATTPRGSGPRSPPRSPFQGCARPAHASRAATWGTCGHYNGSGWRVPASSRHDTAPASPSSFCGRVSVRPLAEPHASTRTQVRDPAVPATHAECPSPAPRPLRV